MLFGRHLQQVIAFSDPEWTPYWLDYDFLKKMLEQIDTLEKGKKTSKSLKELSSSSSEVKFFRQIKIELRKANEFYAVQESVLKARKERLCEGYQVIKDSKNDSAAFTLLSRGLIKLCEDMLLLKNFAVVNYCGFSKILKKHDKITGANTRDAFMRNIMEKQYFVHHEFLIVMIQETEDLFNSIQDIIADPSYEECLIFLEAIHQLHNSSLSIRSSEHSQMEAVGGISNSQTPNLKSAVSWINKLSPGPSSSELASLTSAPENPSKRQRTSI